MPRQKPVLGDTATGWGLWEDSGIFSRKKSKWEIQRPQEETHEGSRGRAKPAPPDRSQESREEMHFPATWALILGKAVSPGFVIVL